MTRLKPRPPQPDDGQLERFLRTAKELDCDPNQAEFEKMLAKIARAKPSGKPTRKG